MAWVLWRGAYLTKSMSWKNKMLIPVYVSKAFCFSGQRAMIEVWSVQRATGG